ncbi:hypothetical protein [Demequina salsinemoris]|uniref:hypothetical protein n=1 Tax=Demequina salsinemoris TaxID=577470 RepID=UPI0007806DA6|nr:hypothetical protein [Demequina salsinemoris]
MRDSLVVTGAALEEAATRIDALAVDLARADEDAGAAENALGEAPEAAPMRHAVSRFASTWSLRRESLHGTLASLSGALRQIDGALDEADSSLARAASPSTAAGHRGHAGAR